MARIDWKKTYGERGYLAYYEKNKSKELSRFMKAIDRSDMDFLKELYVCKKVEDVGSCRELILKNQHSAYDLTPVLSVDRYERIIVDLTVEILRGIEIGEIDGVVEIKEVPKIKEVEKISEKQVIKNISKERRIWSSFEENYIKTWIKEDKTPRQKFDGIDTYTKMLFIEYKKGLKGRTFNSFRGKWYRLRSKMKKRGEI